jgi:hypothetical protein
MTKESTQLTHFVHVPIRAFKDKSGGNQVIFDFTGVNVTYPVSVILYELIQAPAGAKISKIDIEPIDLGPGDPVVPKPNVLIIPNGQLGVVSDMDVTDKVRKYSVTIDVTTATETYTGDPQIINNPIKN